MENTLFLLLLTAALFLAQRHVAASADCAMDSVHQQYFAKRYDTLRVVNVSTTTTSSDLLCASMCSRLTSCGYYYWSHGSSQCHLFRPVVRNETGCLRSGLLEKPRCLGSRKENSNEVCHCSNGLYGPACDKPFLNNLQLIQEYSIFAARDVDQIEGWNRSNLLLTSIRQPTPSNPSILMSSFICAYGNQTYSDSVGAFPVDWLTSIKAFNSFGRFYVFVTAYNSSNSSDSRAKQRLLNSTEMDTLPVEIQSWTDLAVTSSTVFKRSTGDVYLCYAIGDIPTSTPGMKIFRFNPVTETFQLQYTVNDTGPHRKCVFIDIGGSLYALSDSPSKVTTTLHKLTNNGTWQPYRNISNSGGFSGLSVAFSTQAKAHMLVFGHGALQRISIYLWSNDTFTLRSTFNVDFDVEFPYLLEIGHDLFLTASYTQPNTTSKLHFAKFNGTDFNLHGSFTDSKPSGGFHHFWFEDNLYLVVLNKFNVFDNTTPIAYNTGNQQLFQVL